MGKKKNNISSFSFALPPAFDRLRQMIEDLQQEILEVSKDRLSEQEQAEASNHLKHLRSLSLLLGSPVSNASSQEHKL